MAYFFKIDFSEGIGSPAKAALTLIRLKEKKRQKLGAPVLINQLITFQWPWKDYSVRNGNQT